MAKEDWREEGKTKVLRGKGLLFNNLLGRRLLPINLRTRFQPRKGSYYYWEDFLGRRSYYSLKRVSKKFTAIRYIG